MNENGRVMNPFLQVVGYARSVYVRRKDHLNANLGKVGTSSTVPAFHSFIRIVVAFARPSSRA